MIQRVYVVCLILMFLWTVPAVAASFAKIGGEAPDFSLVDMDGKKVSLSDYRDKVVVLNFWATWCPPCKAEMPSMDELNKKLSGDDFVMLAVNVERGGHAKVKAFLRDNPHSFSVLLDEDGKAQRSYGVYRYPETFIIRRDGIIADKVIGAIEWTSPRVVEFIEFLIKG